MIALEAICYLQGSSTDRTDCSLATLASGRRFGGTIWWHYYWWGWWSQPFIYPGWCDVYTLM